MRLNNKGFTLVEMIVVTAIFVVVIMITGDAFKTILTQTSKLQRSEESNIEGVVGLEMFRHDLEQAGFGLPYSYSTDSTKPITYTEAGYLPANTYNDAPSGVPRALVSGDNLTGKSDSSGTVTYGVLANTDYLAIKATSVGSNDASQKWSYLNYSSGGKAAKVWQGGNFKSGDKIVMLRRTFSDSGYGNQLVYDDSSATTRKLYWVGFAASGYTAAYSPALPSEIFYLYGINSSSDVGMPFNRVDYFVATPSDSTKIPSVCAPNTGVLYRASVNHDSTNGGNLTYTPILDCVADMQVVFGWDLADSGGSVVNDSNSPGDGAVDTWSNADGSVSNGSVTLPATTYIRDTIMPNPGHVRTKLKIVKVYILAQNGKKDLNYQYKNPRDGSANIDVCDRKLGELSLTGSHYNLNPSAGPDLRNYRWKVYRLVIKPKNLVSNQ